MSLEEELELVNAVVLTPEQEASIDEAMANARDYYDYEVASSVRYLPVEDLLVLVLKSGRRVAVPVEDLQDLADADRALVAKAQLFPASGSAVRWDELDVDFSVLGLADGRYGSERWMAALPERRRKNAAALLLKTA